MPIILKDYQEEAAKEAIKLMRAQGKAAIVMPPGSGKMMIALKILNELKNLKALYLAPSNPILHDVHKNISNSGMTMLDYPNLKRMTYQKLTQMKKEELDAIRANIIVVDEVQFLGAPEYSACVEEIRKNNPKAVLMGLTADGTRYFDAYRDMVEELFGDCIAANISFEEAVERGILPEATYVSAVYKYAEEMDELKEGIDKIKDEKDKKAAMVCFEELKADLDKDTENLDELLKKYLDPNGKYIIFCKDIEDMNEKVKQAQEIFGRVNSKINVRAVSSDLKENDKTLTEFENDNTEGTLKLMFSVNMLNVGYHIDSLDGVIMMRPTHSPGLFTQQLGRGFSAGGKKKPLILDLVNNYDSCKIIADFAKRIKGRDRAEKPDVEDDKNRITIFDNTRHFRELVEKIKSFTKENRYATLDDKISLFEDFLKENEGEIIVRTTIYKGQPIGQWANQIRSLIKRRDEGKQPNKLIRTTEEQMERLRNAGILDKRFDTTIDEKIELLSEWRKKYPHITFNAMASDEILKETTSSEEEYQELLKEYNRVVNAYRYVRVRRDYLNDDQNQKCQDIFSISEEEKAEEEKLKRLYGLDEKKISLIKKKYGTIEAFRRLYIQAFINHTVDDLKKQSKSLELWNGLRLKEDIDISSPDLSWRTGKLGLLATEVIEEYCKKYDKEYLLSYGNFEEELEAVVQRMKDTDRDVILSRYTTSADKKGDRKVVPFTTIAASTNVVPATIGQRFHKARSRLMMNSRINMIDWENRVLILDRDLWIDVVKEFFRCTDIFEAETPIRMNEESLTKVIQKVLAGVIKTEQRDEDVGFVQKMPKELVIDLLRNRFGDSVNSSDLVIASPNSELRKVVDGGSVPLDTFIDKIPDVGEDFTLSALRKTGDDSVICDLYRECVDSEYAQSKIVEFKIKNFAEEIIVDAESREELEASIDSNSYFDEKKKKELKDDLHDAAQNVIINGIYQEISDLQTMLNRFDTIDNLGLSVRAYNALKRAGINTVQEFLVKTPDEIEKIRNIGRTTVDELIEVVEKQGLTLGKGEVSKRKIDKVKAIEEMIANADLDEEEKEELSRTLYKEFVSEVSDEEIEQLIETETDLSIRDRIYEIAKDERDAKNRVDLEDVLNLKSIGIDRRDKQVYEILVEAGLEQISNFIGITESELLSIPYVGYRRLEFVLSRLECVGIVMEGGTLVYNPDAAYPRNNNDKLIIRLLAARDNVDEQNDILTEWAEKNNQNKESDTNPNPWDVRRYKNIIAELIKYGEAEKKSYLAVGTVPKEVTEMLSIDALELKKDNFYLYNNLMRENIKSITELVDQPVGKVLRIRSMDEDKFTTLCNRLERVGVVRREGRTIRDERFVFDLDAAKPICEEDVLIASLLYSRGDISKQVAIYTEWAERRKVIENIKRFQLTHGKLKEAQQRMQSDLRQDKQKATYTTDENPFTE